ncbi:MAG: hypothetical protein ACREJ3_09215, partial [Polyangiaceae bacterium]
PSCALGFLADPAGLTYILDPAQPSRILQIGFNFWNKYHGQFGTGLPVQAMVIDLARQTLSAATSLPGVYNDIASVDYAGGDHNTADNEYAGYGNSMKPMLELGSGAIIAFLTAAGQIANQSTPADSNQECSAYNFDYTKSACGPNQPFQGAS